MNDYLTITLPHPPKALRPNYRVVWQARLKPKRDARAAAELATRRALEGSRFADGLDDALRPVGYEIRWYYWGAQKPDSDNVLASCKAYLDGIAAALGFNDRDWDCLAINRIHARRDDLEIVVRLQSCEKITNHLTKH